MAPLLHERSNEAPLLLPSHAVICSGCHRESVPDLRVGIRGFCDACLERSRSAAGDDELGGEC